MTKPRKLTPEQEIAYHLDGIAYSLGEARRMLASKVMLDALKTVEAVTESPNTSVAERLAVRSVVQHAITEAAGETP